ncbi:MAG: hypothetical protein AB8F95_08445 [Bacteroidia bacterium]
MHKYIVILLFAGIASGAFCQDSTSIESHLSFETKGSGALAAGANNIQCFGCFFQTVQDNPFHHFAIYSAINHTLTIDEKYKIETGIYLEERSYSGGSNTVANWITFPKILLSARDTFQFLNTTFNYNLKGGDYWNEDVNDMLRIHNFDYHGLTAELGYKDFTLGMNIIGDLSQNIGLGLHQYTQFYLKKKSPKFETFFFLTDNQLTDRTTHTLPQDFNAGNNSRFFLSDKIHLEAQIDFRLNKALGTSFASGFGIEGAFKRLTFRSNLKFYQADFNRGYSSNENLYRGANSYVGRQLYPLKNYYRAYSQWGNYTSRQNRDMLGFELQVKWEQPLKKWASVFVDGDLNIIGDPRTQTGVTIPLYTFGLRSNYHQILKVDLFFTNKHMNLDSFYQTFQASRRPFFGGSVILDLRNIKLISRKVAHRS